MNLTREQAEAVKKAVREKIDALVKPEFAEFPCSCAESAIDSLVEPEKPEFKVGEWYWCASYNGAVRLIGPVTNNSDKRWVWCPDGYTRSVPLTDLRSLAPEERKMVDPQFKAGDFAYCTSWTCIVYIFKVDGMMFRCSPLEGHDEICCGIESLRPLCDDDWTQYVGGNKTHAYYDRDGYVIFKYVHKERVNFHAFHSAVGEEICKSLSLPIMPYELSKKHMPF